MTDASAIKRHGLRPVPARWFELLIARDDITLALETIARTNSVELETHSEITTRLSLPDLHGRLEEYHRLAQRYHGYWPSDGLRPSGLPGQPSRTLSASLDRLYAWENSAGPAVRNLEAIRTERAELHLWRELLEGLESAALRLDLLPNAGPTLAAQAFVLPRRTHITQVPSGVIAKQVQGKLNDFLIAIGPSEEVATLEQDLVIVKGRRLHLPDWLADNPAQSQVRLQQRLQELEQDEKTLLEGLTKAEEEFGLREALGNIARLEWFLTHVESLPVSENFAWITGWTSDLTGEKLQAALDKANVRGMLRYPHPPKGKKPPMVMRNPRWAQPFELFARLLGTPAANEADPSRLLFFIVPLLFGYMFGDVGQGLVLFVGGLSLRYRWPGLRLLVPAGFSSMVFGVLFGSVFSREDIISALWFHPLDEPMTMLIVPLIAGVGLLLLGLTLNAAQSYWRHESRLWWRKDAAVLLLYLGLAGAILHPWAIGVSAAALAWYTLGCLLHRGGGYIRNLLSDYGHLMEQTVQLAINTLSFARVGAFGLAHAGLSSAIMGLAEATDNWAFVAAIMVLGNIIVIALEGLVVSVQITRLVLFEFFIRFLRGEGRRFHPLTGPPSGTAAKQQ